MQYRCRGMAIAMAWALVAASVALVKVDIAHAQLPEDLGAISGLNSVVVVYPDDDSVGTYDTIQEGVDRAITLSQNGQVRMTVLVFGGKRTVDVGEPTERSVVVSYKEYVEIPSDANLYIRGIPADRPWDVVVDGDPAGMDAVISITQPATVDENTLTDRLVIEGLTLRNGKYGVAVLGGIGDAPVLRPTINRCIILGSNQRDETTGNPVQQQAAGVLAQDNAAPLLINCSIGGYSREGLIDSTETEVLYSSSTGVHVTWSDTQPENTTFFTDIVHCTIFMNDDYGVYVDEGANARVRNSIIYRNGARSALGVTPGQPEKGGLVWEQDDLVIEPQSAPWDVPAPPDAGAVAVTLRGRGLFLDPTKPEETRVYFGPPERGNATLWIVSAGVTGAGDPDDIQTLTAYAPPSYQGSPGPVDVHIVRSDGFTDVIRSGFYYTESDAGEPPYVSRVEPESGPAMALNALDASDVRGQWVLVHGARFEAGCQVYWDTNPAAAPDRVLNQTLDAMSPSVIWLGSGLLWAKVPQPNIPPTGKIDVWALNPVSGLHSPDASTMPADGVQREYEYLAEALPSPSIVAVSPATIRGLDAVKDNGDPMTVDLSGWNFGPGKLTIQRAKADAWQPMPVVVKIGGVICPYQEIIDDPGPDSSDLANGIYQGTDDANGDSFDEIRGIQVPSAPLGVAGSYDIEVINYDGQSAILPNGLTYFADGTPALNPGQLDTTDIPWRPANFATGSTVSRRLLGTGFDTGLVVRFTDLASPPSAIKTLAGAGGLGLFPDEAQDEHISHTQSEVVFTMPGANDYLPGQPLAGVEIENAFNVWGQDTTTDTDVKTVRTQFAWTASAAFSVTGLEIVGGWPVDDTPPAALSEYFARMTVAGWRSGMRVFLAGVEVKSPDPVEDSGYVYIHVLPGSMPSGIYGPVDIAVVLPSDNAANDTGIDLYWVEEDAVSIPRMNADGTLVSPSIYAVSPKRVTETGNAAGQVVSTQVTGCDFLGPFAPDGVWVNTSAGPYTVVSLVSADGVAVPLICPATVDPASDLGQFLAARGIAVPYTAAVGAYEVLTSTSIRFTLVDLTSHPVFSNEVDFPRDLPLDVVLSHVDAQGGTLLDSNGDPLPAATLNDSFTLVSDTALVLPVITDLFRLDGEPIVGLATGSLGGAALEEQQLRNTLIALGITIRATDDPASSDCTVFITFPGSPIPAGLDAWVQAGHGYIQIGDTGLNAIPNATTPVVEGALEPVVVTDLTHPITQGTVATKDGRGFWAYGDNTADFFGYATGGQFLATVAGQPGALAITQYGAGRAAYFGWNVYGSLVSANERQLLEQAITWAATSDQRWGTVRGGDAVLVRGLNLFDRGTAPAATPSILFGGAEAYVIPPGTSYAYSRTDSEGNIRTVALEAPAIPDIAGTEEIVYVITPSAPGGLPGPVEVAALARRTDSGLRWTEAALAPMPFTYIMDGMPVITEIRPNYISREASNQASGDKVYFTILGYNFSDTVEVRFDSKDDDEPEYVREHFSVSPYEILVEAAPSDLGVTTAGSDLALTDADYDAGGGYVEVAVSVRNFSDSVTADTDNLTSAPSSVYYYDVDYEPLELQTPMLAFNDVYLNAADYVNVTPGAGCLSVDPLFDPGSSEVHLPGPKAQVLADTDSFEDWWPGKLAWRRDTGDNPMRDKAGAFSGDANGSLSYSPYISNDMELESRPNSPDYATSGQDTQGVGAVPDGDGKRLGDIGADEIQFNGYAELTWYYTLIAPNPVGKQKRGELFVECHINGIRGSLADVILPAYPFFIVPQGGNPAILAHRIPLQIDYHLGGGVYWCSNAEDIDTVVARQLSGRNGPWTVRSQLGTDATPQQGDILADGHAMLFVYVPLAYHNMGGGDILLGWYDPSQAEYSSTALNQTYSDMEDEGLIRDTAIYNRHFLIDTIPPRVYVEAYHPELDGTFITPWDLVVESNDIYTVQDLDPSPPGGPQNHEGLVALDVIWPTGNWWTVNYPWVSPPTNPYPVPVEWEGGIRNPFWQNWEANPWPRRAQIFLNTGSVSNGLSLVRDNTTWQDLAFKIRVRYIDPPVTVSPADKPAPYTNPEQYVIAGRGTAGTVDAHNTSLSAISGVVPLDTREVSGFEAWSYNISSLSSLDIQPVTALTTDNGLTQTGKGLWVFDAGDGAFTRATPSVSAVFTPSGEDVSAQAPNAYPGNTPSGNIRRNEGYVRTNPTSTAYYDNNVLTAEWTVTGIDWSSAHNVGGANPPFNLELRFGATDRAGNQATFLLDPLYLWWGQEVQTQVLGAPETPGNEFTLAWDLIRGKTSGPVTLSSPAYTDYAGPFPLYMYQIFINADMSTGRDGQYWHIYTSTWSLVNQINQDDFRQILRQHAGIDPDSSELWVLVVVQGADEAGNVEPWYRVVPWWGGSSAGTALFEAPPNPVDFTNASSGQLRSQWADALPNWARFKWSGRATPDTAVTPVFFHGDGQAPITSSDTRLGSNTFVVMPEPRDKYVDAQFIIESRYTDVTYLRVAWQLVSENGTIILSGDELPGRPVSLYQLGDSRREKQMRYVFRAAAYIDGSGNSGSVNQQYDLGETIDPTWANVPFVVTPYAVDPRTTPGDQPVKLREEQ